MIAIFAATLLTASAPDVAPVSKAAPQPASEKAEKSDEKVCRRIQETGSHISRRKVCMTKAEWDGVSLNGQKLLRDMLPALTTASPP